MMNSKCYKEVQKIFDDLMQKISIQNCWVLDFVVVKCYYYYVWVYEFLDKLDVVCSFLYVWFWIVMFWYDVDGQVILLNFLLWNYLYYSLYDQVEKLVFKFVFLEQVNNNEWVRYFYYIG